MNYESIKNEFIKFKKEELNYIDNVAKISSNKILTEYEKLEIYRKIKSYQTRLNEILANLRKEVIKNKHIFVDNLNDVIIEFDVDKSFLSSAGIKHKEYKKQICSDYFGVDLDTFKFKLTLTSLIHNRNRYVEINPDLIQNNQKLIENTIYIFCGYYDSSEDCYGPCFGNLEDYIYGIYEDIRDKYNMQEKIHKKKINDFEKGKTIIHSKRYVHSSEIKDIFEEELLNNKNKSLNDCVISTRKRIEELNYTRSPEYKEKVLLDKINELYKKVKGEFIQKEILYSGDFLEIIRETYKLPNEKTVEKEKVIKNGGKNSVIVIAITQDNEYIITFQNRIKDKKIAEFPSGYVENDEGPIESAKRELQEETGYISDDLFIVDEAFTSPGIDNSVTYIVLANNCIKTNDEIKTNCTELVNYELFSEIELKYLIRNNIMNGAMNKLAYYNLINNVDDCNITCTNNNKKIYKMQRKKTNPLYN